MKLRSSRRSHGPRQARTLRNRQGVFTFLFGFIPNARVRFLPALIGGATAGVLWRRSARDSRPSCITRRSSWPSIPDSPSDHGDHLGVRQLAHPHGRRATLVLHPEPAFLRRGHEQIRLASALAERVAFNVMFSSPAFQKGEAAGRRTALHRIDIELTLAGVVHALEHAGSYSRRKTSSCSRRDMSEIRLSEILEAIRKRSAADRTPARAPMRR